MTTPTPAESPAAAGSSGIPLRSLTAWALIALAAVTVFFSFLHWIFPSASMGFLNRFHVGSFANITVMVAPLLGLLVAAKIGPAVRGAKLMGLVALGTYAAAVLFGVVAFLVSIADKFDPAGRSGFYAFGHILQGFGNLITELLLLALLTVAALWSYRIFAGMGGTLPKVNLDSE